MVVKLAVVEMVQQKFQMLVAVVVVDAVLVVVTIQMALVLVGMVLSLVVVAIVVVLSLGGCRGGGDPCGVGRSDGGYCGGGRGCHIGILCLRGGLLAGVGLVMVVVAVILVVFCSWWYFITMLVCRGGGRGWSSWLIEGGRNQEKRNRRQNVNVLTNAIYI